MHNVMFVFLGGLHGGKKGSFSVCIDYAGWGWGGVFRMGFFVLLSLSLVIFFLSTVAFSVGFGGEKVFNC